MATRAKVTRQTVVSIDRGCLARHTDMLVDHRCTETQGNCDAHGENVIFKPTMVSAWQGVEPVAGPRWTRSDETGTLNVVGGPIQ